MVTHPLITPVETAAALIAAHPYFAGPPAVPVLTEKVGDITATITSALAKLGLAVTVLVPSLGAGKPRGDQLEVELDLVVEVAELVAMNRSGKAAWAAAGEVIRAIHRKPNGLDPAGAMHRPGLNELTVDEELAIRRQPHPRYLVYHVYASTRVVF